MCQKRILLLFRMEEVPLVELIFYARKSSHIYFIVFVVSLTLLILAGSVNRILLSLSITELVLMMINIIVLRIVITKPSKWNTFIALLVVIFLEIFYTAITVLGVIQGFLTPLYRLVVPLAWIVLEITTIFIMYGFHRKLIDSDAENDFPQSHSTKLLDEEIVYAHSSG